MGNPNPSREKSRGEKDEETQPLHHWKKKARHFWIFLMDSLIQVVNKLPTLRSLESERKTEPLSWKKKRNRMWTEKTNAKWGKIGPSFISLYSVFSLRRNRSGTSPESAGIQNSWINCRQKNRNWTIEFWNSMHT